LDELCQNVLVVLTLRIEPRQNPLGWTMIAIPRPLVWNLLFPLHDRPTVVVAERQVIQQ